MVRREEVIKKLERMGYSVGIDVGSGDAEILTIVLTTAGKHSYMAWCHMGDLDKPNIVEFLVRNVNDVIKRDR